MYNVTVQNRYNAKKIRDTTDGQWNILHEFCIIQTVDIEIFYVNNRIVDY